METTLQIQMGYFGRPNNFLIDDNGTSIAGQTAIKNSFFKSFTDLLERPVGESRIDHMDPLLSSLPSLSGEHIEILSTPFTKEEIKKQPLVLILRNRQVLTAFHPPSFNITGQLWRIVFIRVSLVSSLVASSFANRTKLLLP